MRNNVNTFKHPKVICAIRFALWLARLEAKKKSKQFSGFVKGTQYVRNRKGNNYLRVDVYGDGVVRIFGDQSRDVTGIVLQSALLGVA